MTSFMEIMTPGGSMMNRKGATEMLDEWAMLHFKN
jgi:hypothetical protein